MSPEGTAAARGRAASRPGGPAGGAGSAGWKSVFCGVVGVLVFFASFWRKFVNSGLCFTSGCCEQIRCWYSRREKRRDICVKWLFEKNT